MILINFKGMIDFFKNGAFWFTSSVRLICSCLLIRIMKGLTAQAQGERLILVCCPVLVDRRIL